MKRVVLATVAGLLALATPLPAHADGPGYVGSCRLASVGDGQNGVLGSGPHWSGIVAVSVAPTNRDDLILAADCSIKVNSGAPHTVLATWGQLPGAPATGAARASYDATIFDTVQLCTHVVTTWYGQSDNCQALVTKPACPEQICGPLAQVPDPLEPYIGIVLILLEPTLDQLPTSSVPFIPDIPDGGAISMPGPIVRYA